MRCTAGSDPENGCEMTCGPSGAAAYPATCSDGTQVCGQAC